MKKLISILLVLAMVFSFVAVTAADDSVSQVAGGTWSPRRKQLQAHAWEGLSSRGPGDRAGVPQSSQELVGHVSSPG